MPLFLVRWPQMEASLISARDERELVDVIDQLDTPTACTWTEYDGPLWIDVDLNLEVEVEGTLEDATARRVSVKGREALDSCRLRFSTPGTDASSEMISAIVQAAYPNTYAALEEAMERAAETRNETWVPPASKLKEAIARDLVSHQHAILGRGVSFDESGGVIATETLYFLRRSKSRYEPIEAAHLREFTLGRRKLKPESDGFVRVALAKVALNIEDSDEIEFEAVGYKFRTKPDGTIIDVHRADAFPEDQAQGEAALFEARRNQAVSWELTDEDVNALERAVERHRGRFQRPIHDRDRD